MKTETLIKVRGYHLDAYQHVNNARYLEFLEEARWDYLDKINALPYFQSQNWGFIVVNINIDYKWPAIQGDILNVSTELKETGNTSFVFEQIVLNQKQEKISAKANVTFVLVDLANNKPLRLSEDAKNFMSGSHNH